MENIVLSSIPREEFAEMIHQAVSEAISGLKADLFARPDTGKQPEEDKYLTIEETAMMLKVSKMTIHNLRKAGKLKYYKIGRAVRFKEREVLSAMKEYDWRKK